MSRRGNNNIFREKGSSSISIKSDKPKEENDASKVEEEDEFGYKKPLRCFICNETHEAQDCPRTINLQLGKW
jgi:hypothetical protein